LWLLGCFSISVSWSPSKAAVPRPRRLFSVHGSRDDERSCLPPGRLPEIKRIYLISDATGVMSRSILLKALAQFDTCADETAPYATQPSEEEEESTATSSTCDVRTRTFTFVRSESALATILQKAKEREACVLYTIAQPQLRQYTQRACEQLGLKHCVDLIGPTLDSLSGFLQEEPLGIPALFLGTGSSNSSNKTGRSLNNHLSDSYYQRIDAVEFCLKADDGQAPWLLPEADIVLVGVSRSGKTPLAVVLSQTMSLKVANIPLVLGIEPPQQLLQQVDPSRVFCLTISPSELRKIRTNRLEKRGVKNMEERFEQQQHNSRSNLYSSPPKSNYADRAYILQDLGSVRKLCQEYGWTEIDVTGRAVEETATSIVEMFNQRFSEKSSSSSSSGISNQHIG